MILERIKSAFARYPGGWLAVALTSAFVIAVLALPLIPSRSCSCENACINNLRQIDGAKQTWALENHSDSNAIPTWENIQPYLGPGPSGTIPTCPQGGIYTLGKIKDPPTCSIKGHALD